MPPRKPVIDLQPDFSGGLAIYADAAAVGERQVAEAQNARISTDGSVVFREGTQELTAARIGASGAVRGGAYWGHTGFNYIWVYGNLYRLSGDVGGAATLMTGSHWNGIGLELTDAITMKPFRDAANEALYITGRQTSFPAKLVGTTVSNPTWHASLTDVSLLEVYNLRLFGARPLGSSGGPRSVLFYSALGNGDTLGDPANGGGQAIIRSLSSAEITGLANVGGALLIFHSRGVHRFTGWSQDDISIDDGTTGMSSTIGCIAPASVVVVNNVAYFLSENGFFAATASDVSDVGKPINELFRALSGADRAALPLTRAAHYATQRIIVWSIPGHGAYVYDYGRQVWTGRWNGAYLSPTCLWEGFDSAQRPCALLGTSDGFVLRQQPTVFVDRADSLGGVVGGRVQPYTLQLTSRELLRQDDLTEIAYRFAYLHGTNGAAPNAPTMAITYRVNGGAWLSAGAPTSLPARVHLGGRGRALELRYAITPHATAAATPVALDGLGAEGFAMGRRFR